jgi:hypothetical protein
VTALQRSQDRKVSNSVLPSGGARIANSFGLPAGKAFSCPGATAYCERICYAGRIERGQNKAVFPMLKRNFDLLKSARTSARMLELLDPMVDEFARECEKWDAPKVFRIHWDGDYFSPGYVTAWTECIRKHPDVRFWTYTRVASAARALHRAALPNLGLYFSGDPDNKRTALQLQREGIRVAFVAIRSLLLEHRCPKKRSPVRN